MEVAKERVPDLKSRFLTPQPLASRLWPLFPVVVPLFHRRRPSASVSVKLVIPCVLFYFFQLYLKQRQRSRSKPPSPPPELPSTVELSPRLNRVLSRSLLSPRASSGPAHVSSRANSIAKQADSPYFVGLNRVSEDPFDELNNPDGFFQLGLAENKGGYRGFYSQNTIPLTPKVVNNIHKRGGTILGTSRGGHDTKKIVDCIQDRGINQVRKPYTITKQRERWTEEEHKKFLEALKFLYAAMSGKFAQNVLIAQCCQQNRQFSPQYRRDKFSPNTHNLLPFQRGKLAWPGKSTMQLQILSKLNQGFVYCNAAPSATAVPSLDKVDFLKLQNGSDIRGVAVGGVEGEPVNLTEPVTEAIAAAFSAWLLDKKKSDASRRLRVSIGHDSRISAHKLQDAVSRGIAGAGLDVVQYGLASTPAMFNSTLTENDDYLCPADGAIMVTASHLPYNRNGFKFFTNAGGLGKPDIKDILERAANIYQNFTAEALMDSEIKASSSIKRVDYMNFYTSDLVAAVRKASGNIEKPLEVFHIIVDAGNGAGGFFAGKVLEPLGAITSGSQFLEPDGLFPNHIPNPEDKEAMKSITEAVLTNKADLGIIFDTDVDRSAAVDYAGCEFNRNRLIALMSAIVLEEHPGTTIVTDSVTSDGLTTFIEKKLGGKHRRFKRGYKNVIDEAIRLNSVGEESHLAIETSGHGALKENHWLDDGAYLMVKILNKLASARASGLGSGTKVLTDLVEGLQEPAIAVELRIKIDQNHADLKGGSFREYGEAVLKHLENIVDSDPKLQKATVNYEGVRVSGFGGWFLLRLSLHDPVFPLNIEAQTKDDAVKLGLAVLSAVNEFHALDTSPLIKFVQV